MERNKIQGANQSHTKLIALSELWSWNVCPASKIIKSPIWELFSISNDGQVTKGLCSVFTVPVCYIPTIYYVCHDTSSHIWFSVCQNWTLLDPEFIVVCTRSHYFPLIFILTVCSFNFANNLQTLLALVLTVLYIVSEISNIPPHSIIVSVERLQSDVTNF